MYLAESKCMLGRYEESLTHLEQTEELTASNKNSESYDKPQDGKSGSLTDGLVKQVELKFRTINVSQNQKGSTQG
jgi:hypothetical protein